ncbi:hypothetical protein MSG28_014862 [Choristoneura fumiferana]|uniref:Uncharacterized protein n=1 Tax=Choristoneura fumiferana TaxID=7141 RepID=A0ACC0JT95_CHOFU|nr:hypothetical protein MSG28_014862 [Choristoneura fumiferana]
MAAPPIWLQSHVIIPPSYSVTERRAAIYFSTWDIVVFPTAAIVQEKATVQQEESLFIDPDIKDKWIMATGKTNWFPTNNSRLCSVHFREDDFLPTAKRKILSKSACPTIAVWTSTERKRVGEQREASVVLSLGCKRVFACDGRLLAPLDSLVRGGRQADIAERSTVDAQPSSPVLPKPQRQTIVTEQRMKIRSLQCRNRRYLEKIKRLEELLRLSEERFLNGDKAFISLTNTGVWLRLH